jgi:hypothetical protein
MNVEAISVTPTLNFQSLIIVPESLPFGEKDPSCSSLPQSKATRAKLVSFVSQSPPKIYVE